MGWQSMRFAGNARECVDKYILVDCQNGGYLPFLRTLNSRKRERDYHRFALLGDSRLEQVRSGPRSGVR